MEACSPHMRATAGEHRTYGGVSEAKCYREPPVSRYLKFSLKLKTLPFLFFLQHHDIMPYEDKHLVFVIQSERTLWC